MISLTHTLSLSLSVYLAFSFSPFPHFFSFSYVESLEPRSYIEKKLKLNLLPRSSTACRGICQSMKEAQYFLPTE